ncbi:carboxymuconolactone decarboxylase family protein [Terasakiella sp.]|uniref:carboxymuconolactone decarboxylase family protein n=1 Tax=Terasakiella sp. TaxID=2034861 RepID=UPI003AA991AD
MSNRLNHFEASPAILEKMAAFSMATKQETSIDQTLLHLVDIRVSMLNGCAFCLDMHVKQAKIHGERELRLYHLGAWRESALFTDRERAALAWAEEVTRLSSEGVSDALYAETREHFSEKELCDLNFAVMAINSWNRLAVPFQAAPGSADEAFGLTKAGLV